MACAWMSVSTTAWADKSPLYQIQVESIDGTPYSLSKYQGKVLLIVNTASRCGFTSQYEGLEKLHEKYKDKGLVILGIPCNQFLGQEPGTEKEIKNFCTRKFNVQFPMLKKADVKGDKQHPLYKFLLNESQDHSSVHWNFEKFLISKDGHVLKRFYSRTKPEDAELTSAIESALK
jgi:glutathione peroxidase